MPRAKPSVNHLAITSEQFLCHGIGNIAGRAVCVLGAFEYFHGDIIDLRTMVHGGFTVVTSWPFIGQIDHAAGIDDVVWRIENAT